MHLTLKPASRNIDYDANVAMALLIGIKPVSMSVVEVYGDDFDCLGCPFRWCVVGGEEKVVEVLERAGCFGCFVNGVDDRHGGQEVLLHVLRSVSHGSCGGERC